MQDVTRRKFLSLWITRGSNPLGGIGKVVSRMPKLNVGTQQKPIRPGLSKRHSNTAGVYDSNPPDRPIELQDRISAQA